MTTAKTLGKEVSLRHGARKRVGRPNGARAGKAPMGLSRAVRSAIDCMILEGLNRCDAAERAGLRDNSLYQALRNPEVLSYFNATMSALRTAETARGIHVAARIRDDYTLGGAAGATAQIKAAAFIENAGHDAGGLQLNVQINNPPAQVPGYVVAIDPRYADAVPPEASRIVPRSGREK